MRYLVDREHEMKTPEIPNIFPQISLILGGELFCGVLYEGCVRHTEFHRYKWQNSKPQSSENCIATVTSSRCWCGVLRVNSSNEPGKATISRQHLTWRTSEIPVHKIGSKARLAYLSHSSADEGLYFWCSVRRRWCCCGRPGCTSSLLIIVFYWRCPPPGQHSGSSHHLLTHARAPHRVAIATRDERPSYCLIWRCS
jgi:hypothetical protein